MEPINEGSESGFVKMNNPHRNSEQSAVGDKATEAQRQFNEQTARELALREEKNAYAKLVAQLNAAPKGEEPTQESRPVSPLRKNAPGGQPMSAGKK